MPRYFFNICTDDFEEVDLVGKNCRDEVTVLAKAFETASAVLHRQLHRDQIPANGRVEVQDEDLRTVLSLPLAAAAY